MLGLGAERGFGALPGLLAWQEFFRELGISRPTFWKYRRDGRLPPPERVGRYVVFTQEYLQQCRKILAAQGLPRRRFVEAGKKGGRPKLVAPALR